MEKSNLPDKELKLMIIEIPSNSGEEWKNRVRTSTELENIRNKQLELKNTITKMKNTLEGMNSTLDDSGQISYVAERRMEITQ